LKDKKVAKGLPQVVTLLKLFLVVPATSASAERSFSLLRRIKTWLRSTTGQERLNHLAIINAYSDEVYEAGQALIDEIIKEFVLGCESRKLTFGLV